jgi:UDP-galactopyranose mutase
MANQTSNVHFVGRLATYKYYNMDQVVAQALTLFTQLSKKYVVELSEIPKKPNLILTTKDLAASTVRPPLTMAGKTNSSENGKVNVGT